MPGIKLTGTNSPLKPKPHSNPQQIYGGAFDKNNIIDAFNSCKLPTDEKIRIAKKLFSGWEKLEDNELQEFAKLYKLLTA